MVSSKHINELTRSRLLWGPIPRWFPFEKKPEAGEAAAPAAEAESEELSLSSDGLKRLVYQ